MNWHEFFIGLAYKIAEKSKDPSTQIGCIIVNDDNSPLVIGYNGLPRGCDDNVPERNDRPEKYHWYAHGEENAIANAASEGIRLKGSTAYIIAPPCTTCARLLIQARIRKIIVPKDHVLSDRSDWEVHFERSLIMLKEAGVLFEWYHETTAESQEGKPGSKDSEGHYCHAP